MHGYLAEAGKLRRLGYRKAVAEAKAGLVVAPDEGRSLIGGTQFVALEAEQVPMVVVGMRDVAHLPDVAHRTRQSRRPLDAHGLGPALAAVPVKGQRTGAHVGRHGRKPEPEDRARTFPGPVRGHVLGHHLFQVGQDIGRLGGRWRRECECEGRSKVDQLVRP